MISNFLQIVLPGGSQVYTCSVLAVGNDLVLYLAKAYGVNWVSNLLSSGLCSSMASIHAHLCHATFVFIKMKRSPSSFGFSRWSSIRTSRVARDIIRFAVS